MKNFRYIDNITSLKLDQETCIRCENCVKVCPHRIFVIRESKVEICDLDACMECGACSKNCPVTAISVAPGVGCAAEIIANWVNRFTGKKIMAGCC